MTRTIHRIGIVLGALSMAGCVGDPPGTEEQPGAADAGSVDEADAGDDVVVVPLEVSGTIIDYFASPLMPGKVVADAALSTDGLAPAIDAIADGLGAYVISVLPASLFYVNVTATGYAPSRNAPTQLLDEALLQDQYAASIVGIERQYVGAGGLGTPIIPVLGGGIIMLDISRNNGLPALGVPVANIVLTEAGIPDVPVGLAYLVSPDTTDLSSNDIVINPLEATIETIVDATGRARGGFLNVPPGDYTITVTIPADGVGDGEIQVVQATVLADGATFVNTAGGGGDVGGGGGGGGQANIVLDPNSPLGFTEDIYPVLMAVADGGDGCITCHNANHILPFTGTPAEVLARLNEEAIDPIGVLRINLIEPALSPFVTNPVYEAIPNHPNAFWTVNSNHYIGILAWITQGAALLRADAELPIPE